MSAHIVQNARLDESQAKIKIAWRNINNLRYADDSTLMAEEGRKGKGGGPGRITAPADTHCRILVTERKP